MANYVKFKQGLKKDFNTTNQPLTNGMIYFVIDENNHGSIYYDTVVDGAKATKQGVVHRVKFSGLPIKITGSVTGTGAISADGESITINTVTNHSHGLAHMNFNVTLSDNDTDLNWTRLGNQNSEGFWLKSVRGQSKAPAWFQPDFSAGIAFGGADTKGIISLRYQNPSVRFAGGNGNAPVWYFTITGAKSATYDLSKIGGHSSDAAKLDHNITFKIDSVADATKGGNGVTTNLSGNEVKLVLPASISGFSLLQSTRFQGNADTATTAAKLGRSGNTANPMTFNWSGKDGQPTWVWGGEDGTNMYVYKPSNFKVAHATSAAGLDHDITIKINPIADATKGGNGVTTKLTEAALSLILPASLSGFNLIQSTRFQGNADTATVAAKLGNGGNTGDPMIFNWSGQGGQPTWIWGGNSKTNMYVYNPSNFKVNHAVSSTGLDHNVTFKISKVANGTTGETGVTTKLDKDESITLILPSNLSGFDNIQSTRFQGNADSATWAGYSKGLYLYPDTRQADMNFNLAGANYIKRVTYAMATSTTTKNKPPVGDANILSFGWDNSGYGSQLAIQNGGAGHLAVRGSGSSNGASSWGSWSTVLDSSNYTSYVNNYYWANEQKEIGFIANGEIVQVVKVRRVYEMYGFRFADIIARFPDYDLELDVKVLLDTLQSNTPALSKELNDKLFYSVLEDYGDITTKAGKINKMKTDPHYNVLQVKYAYAVTCHKAQGGQWANVFVDFGYITEEMIDEGFYRWLYTAITRATSRVYLVNLPKQFKE